MRTRMLWIAFVLLVILAGIEAALALMRDMLIADKQALLQSLAASQAAAASDSWLSRIPTIGQMVLGFILPFALAFVAIPLESFIASARTVGGAALVMLTRALAMVLRIAGNVIRQLTRVLATLYDIVIVVPLLVERLVRNGRAPAKPRVDRVRGGRAVMKRRTFVLSMLALARAAPIRAATRRRCTCWWIPPAPTRRRSARRS